MDQWSTDASLRSCVRPLLDSFLFVKDMTLWYCLSAVDSFVLFVWFFSLKKITSKPRLLEAQETFVQYCRFFFSVIFTALFMYLFIYFWRTELKKNTFKTVFQKKIQWFSSMFYIIRPSHVYSIMMFLRLLLQWSIVVNPVAYLPYWGVWTPSCGAKFEVHLIN